MNNPLLLHVIDELRMGGAQTHLITMLREWQRRGKARHRVLVLFGEGPLAQPIREMGIEVESLDLREKVRQHSYWSAQSEILNAIRRHKPQIVEAHLTYSRLLGLFAAFRAGVKGRFGFEQGDIFFNSPKWQIANFIGQCYAKKIIVCSNTLKEWVHKTHHVHKRKLEVFYNCIDPMTFQPSHPPKLSRDSLQIPSDACVFGAVGTLGAGVNKRMDVCIESLAQLHNQGQSPYLIICGDGPKRIELETLAQNLNISSYVKFLGTRTDVADVLSLCNAFCHAAPFEPFGIVCIEAMFIGLPVIVPNSGGISEIVDPNVGFKYTPLSSRELSENMLEVIKNPQVAQGMGQSGRNLVVEKFTVGRYLTRLQSLYGMNPIQ